MQTIEKGPLVSRAVDALRRGEAKASRRLFEEIVAAGHADGAVWLGLALACRAEGDHGRKLEAVDQALAINPRDLRALSLKADHFADAGDLRAAAAFYGALVNAAPPADQLTPDLAREVARAQQMTQRYAGAIEAHIRDRLAAAGFAEGSSPRFAQSLEIALGRRAVFHQAPRHYFFPELPHVQFFDRATFPWLEALEAHTPAIREEVAALMSADGAFSPYVERAADRPLERTGGMLENPDWSAHYLWKNGELVPENAERSPRTVQALEEVPLPRIPGRSPMAIFSLLQPRTRIPPHNGFINTRLICHLPLVVPPGCGFRVGNEVRQWQEGRAWLFDDTIEHEAWNDSDRPRAILLFEVWRPELSEEERALVSTMVQAIDALGRGADWGA
ncbi:aspartyl/asparaginyl beta-hydroxylase domain-containing protein [Phenylobacterium sp.]|uniref:aspartyl/asparaginyl beta-hydroxylase domain-containing protein n=1 Tax=Phenylobacterium sp. TaxID=1871053 RepID=UPI002F941F3E